MSADLRHVDTWLFDLDNTLYPLDSGLGVLVTDRITDYVQRVTGLPRKEARALQKGYLEEHGLTLGGMMANHGVDPQEYHAHLNEVALDVLTRDPEMLAGLRRLPGRRLIFTNADEVHTERVLAKLGLTALFDDVFHIGDADYVPKPAPETFRRISEAHDLFPEKSCFFEDTERNLKPAFDLGMTTVLVGAVEGAPTADYVTYRTDRLAPFLLAAKLKEAA
ncbi:MAG: pyrimidine 5'-nucleotidase [Caulobacteraceae bacterium]|nr:pyrimidine 5'-nucleotidase [Caulobacteraceae bacterium]